MQKSDSGNASSLKTTRSEGSSDLEETLWERYMYGFSFLLTRTLNVTSGANENISLVS